MDASYLITKVNSRIIYFYLKFVRYKFLNEKTSNFIASDMHSMKWKSHSLSPYGHTFTSRNIHCVCDI